MLYSIVFVSATRQHEPAIVYICPLPLESPSSPPPSHPLGCHSARGLGSLPRTTKSHWLLILHMSFMFPCCSLHSSTLSFPNWAHKPVHCICLSVPARCIQMTFDLRIHRPRLLASVQDSSKGGRSPLWHLHGSLVPLFATCLFHCPSPSTQGVILKYPPINFLHIQTYAS